MKRLLTTLSQKWPEYLLEILVIIIGIIGAYMLNSWKESNDNSKEEENLLVNLKVDFEFNQKELKDYRDLILKASSSGLQILRYISEQDYPSEGEADSLIYDVIGISTYNPADGALLDILSTGKVTLIQNDSLRNLLLSFSGKVLEINQLETRANDQLRVGMYPYLFDHFQFAQMDSRLNKFGVDWKFAPFDSDLEFMFKDRKFESMVDDHVWRCFDISEKQSELLSDINSILKLINQEINN